MHKACKLVGRLYVECQVQSHVVGYAIGVAIGIEWHVSLGVRVVVLTCRHRGGSACGVVEVAREAVSLGNLVVQHGLHVVWTVVLRWIPLAVVQRHGHALVVLLQL